METALRRMADMLDAAAQAVSTWFADTEGVVLTDPGTWPLGLWLLLAAFAVLVLALAVRRRARPTLEVRPPQILITQGELVPEERAGRLGAGMLTMTVSNLGRYPVQLLESASRTGSRGRTGVAETVHLVPALSEVEMRVQLPVGKLDDGLLDVYCYAAATRTKLWRHQAELIWEPWAKRFKVAPLEQRVEPARSLASERRDVVRMDDVAKVEQTAARHAAASARHVESGARREANERRAARETTPRRQAEVGMAPTQQALPSDEAGPASRPSGSQAPASQASGSLAALLGSRQAPLIVPPRDAPGNATGAAARAARVSATSPSSGQAGSGPVGGQGYGLQRSGVQPVEVRATAAGASASSMVADSQLPSAPSDDAPALPDGGEGGPRVRPTLLPAGPAALRRALPPAPDVEDPDAPPRPTRPRDRRLEFPDDF